MRPRQAVVQAVKVFVYCCRREFRSRHAFLVRAAIILRDVPDGPVTADGFDELGEACADHPLRPCLSSRTLVGMLRRPWRTTS